MHFREAAIRYSPEAPQDVRARGATPLSVAKLLAAASGALFAILLTAVLAGWSVVDTCDRAIVGQVNDIVSARPALATGLRGISYLGGSGVAWTALSVAVVWLVIRRQPALATYVAATGLGSAALTTGVKALVERARPTVTNPVEVAGGMSFPSGHSLGSAVTYGVLLLVFLPDIPRRWHRAAVVGTVAVVVAVGLSRVGLGVHYPSDVLGGWLLATCWLLTTAIAFRRWQSTTPGLEDPPLSDGLAPDERDELLPAPAHGAALPDGWHSVARLVVAWVLIWGAVVGVGTLVTSRATTIQAWDTAVAEWFAGHRSEGWSDVMLQVSRIGDTSSVLAVLLIAVAVSFAVTRRWRPALFLVTAVAGEVLIFVAGAAVVGRHRPPVVHLTPGLPPTSSFPSGHVAATLAVYGAIALVVVASARRPVRWAAPALALCAAVAVAAARMYIGVHFFSDAAVSILFCSAWLTVCFVILRPASAASGPQVCKRQPGEPSTHPVPARGAPRR